MDTKGFDPVDTLILKELSEVKRAVEDLRSLVACELYGANGREGLKQKVAILWEGREQGNKVRLAVVGAFLTALASLVVSLVRWALGI